MQKSWDTVPAFKKLTKNIQETMQFKISLQNYSFFNKLMSA